ncbi:coiled-coil domain-containing protein, partial [Clarias magur]
CVHDPTVQLAEKRKSHELVMCKMRLECQKEKIDELTRERDYLKEQLASALRREATGSTQAIPLSSDSSSDSSSESSSDIMSDSSSNTSSSDGDRKKKKKKKRMKMKIK